ncbi:hypothetical protein Cadr_000018826 [Camelus dromedarius]|uniref:Uncharacterized protein n=1 Tax=Camelus dromedarius TaxID=9838 RepID=A0A5N4D1U2_CAMDR|nr:hypothetical protein Cadr_000018826 [Camelus dromedarius]
MMEKINTPTTRSPGIKWPQHLPQALPTESQEWGLQACAAHSMGSHPRHLPQPTQETHNNVDVVDDDFQHRVVRRGVHFELVQRGRQGPLGPVDELPGQALEPLLLNLMAKDALQDLG